MQSKFGRRGHALRSIAEKRSSHVVNLNALVRVYLLDGSSKVLQMAERSTVRDVLSALKFNLDLQDVSTLALFRVLGFNVRRLELGELVADALRDPTESGQEVRLLLRSWISFRYGVFDAEVFQYGVHHKQPTTALWLAFMEATFMAMTGQLHLTEDEAMMLGCLKMQAESGDFNPAVHNLNIIKNRVTTRFPEPFRSKMKALCSSTLGGSRSADELASRVQAMYARVAGKSKVEAQIDYLESLRTWCPFYGSTFYEVQCQYDDNPLDASNTPPVISMNASIGPRAIFLLTTTGTTPVVMRHAYKRIIKWVAHSDKHIFMYWVVKPNLRISELEEYQEEHRSKGGELDTRQFCDCVYLVTSQVKEVEYLVKSYMEALTDIPPALPGASGDLLSPSKHEEETTPQNAVSPSNDEDSEDNDDDDDDNEDDEDGNRQRLKPSRQRLSVFFNVLGGTETASSEHVTSGSGLANRKDGGEEEFFGDDTAAVANSFFKNMYKPAAATDSKKSSRKKNVVIEGDPDLDEDACVSRIPPNVTYAASMSELKRIAEETQFSDEEEDNSGDEEDDDGNDEEDDRAHIKTANSTSSSGNQNHAGGTSVSAFRRASLILFGGSKANNNGPKGDSEEGDFGSSDDGD